MHKRQNRLNGLAWIFGGWLIVYMAVTDFITMKNGVIRGAELWGRDFINLWTGGKLINAGDYTTLYTQTAFAAFQQNLFGPLDLHVYSYPPTGFPIASLFSLLPYPVALGVWLAGSGGLFLWAVRPYWPNNGWPLWLALLTPAALVNIWAGHFGFFFGALFLLSFRWLDARPVLAGAIIGLFAIKPQLAVLIPLVLLLRGNWRAIVSAAVSTVSTVLLSGLIYGWSAWEAFLTRATGKQVSVIDAQGAFFGKMSASAATAVLDLGGGWTLALAAQAVLAMLGIALVVIAARRRIPIDRLALLTATCTFLVLPYSINYDLVVVCIGAWVVMADCSNAPFDRTLATIGFVAPQVGLLLAIMGLPVMPLMLVALAVAQFRVANRPAAPATATAAHSA